MKWIVLFSLTMMMFTVSCGDSEKSKKSSSSVFTSSLTTKEGYYNLQSQALEVGSTTYPPSQEYAQVMNQALEQAQRSNVQPVTVNGVQKLRARITAQLNTYNQGYNTGYPQTPNQTQGTLTISSIQFY